MDTGSLAPSGVHWITLGRTDVRIAPLGAGTWAWGDRFVWGYGREYGAADVAAAYRESLAAGVTLFDTAEIYGQGWSERLLGECARGLGSASSASEPSGAPGGGAPGDASSGGAPGSANGEEAASLTGARRPVIATKFYPLPWRWWQRGSVVRALRGSLRRLGLASVDLYQIHWPYPPWGLDTWAAALADIVEQGLARAVGVSNYSADQLRRTHAALARRGVPLASNQVHYSLLHRRPERNGVQAACRELGVTLIAYSPLEMGLLTGKYGPNTPPANPLRRRRSAHRLESLPPLVATLREIGAAHGGKSPAQVALNWLLAKEAVPIPGAKNGRQAQDNAGALGWRLRPEEVERLDQVSAPLS